MAAPGITIVFSFDYRGNPEEWSQQYHLASDFTNEADFQATFTALRNAIRPTMSSEVQIMRAYGYHNTDSAAAYVQDVSASTIQCTGSYTAAERCPGDAAAWTRWKTGALNSKGKPIYLRKYFHDVFRTATAGLQDTLVAAQKAALDTFGATASTTGFNGHGIATPAGATVTWDKSSTYITTRTLKRRGRRPTPP